MSELDLTTRDPVDISVPIVVAKRSAANFSRTQEPVTFGVPMPRGYANDAESFTLSDGAGRAVPTDARVLDRWADGSIRWLLVDGQIDSAAAGTDILHLTRGTRPPSGCLTVQKDSGVLVINSGLTEFRLGPGRSSPFASITAGGRAAVNVERSGFRIQDRNGMDCQVFIDDVALEESGALRAVIAASGTVRAGDGTHLLDMLVRLHFYAGCPTVRMLIRLRNPKAAEHPNGFWDLGGSASVYVKDASFVLGLDAGASSDYVVCSSETDSSYERAGTASVYQDSSGGENWQSSNHVNRFHQVPNVFRGYRLHIDGSRRDGLRATPVVVARGETGFVAATMPHFWQNFPKSIEATSSAVVVGLFPGEYADVHEIQGGEQKTHELFVGFAPDGVTSDPLAWCRSRLLPHPSPEWYCSSQAVPYLTSSDTLSDEPRQQLINLAIEGDDTFAHKRELVDEYGWRHFGDNYADHEAVRSKGVSPLVSHYNNQYDAVGGFASQFMRSGDVRWWVQMEELASHVVDIDIYHTDTDKSAYNHGLFWHTYHYGDADTATHRSYPRAGAAVIGGGGPSPDQNYTTGLMLHYFLTGESASRDTVIDSAQYVVDADDGNKTVFRWLSRSRTGAASASGTYSYHGPGRSPANSVNALIDGFRLSAHLPFMEKAEELIRRCIHPNDDIDALNLLDAEHRWFYTMFLQSLGKYLDDKAERGELDAMYAYARASLLHFARWMAVNEAPYLDHPERLEFPTETWAAQDIRKSDCFYYASMHASDPERSRFRQLAAFYYDYATTTLRLTSSRALARPIVILLTSGVLHTWCVTHNETRTGPPEESAFGTPLEFVPQKVKAKRRALSIGLAVAALSGCVLYQVIAGRF